MATKTNPPAVVHEITYTCGCDKGVAASNPATVSNPGTLSQSPLKEAVESKLAIATASLLDAIMATGGKVGNGTTKGAVPTVALKDITELNKHIQEPAGNVPKNNMELILAINASNNQNVKDLGANIATIMATIKTKLEEYTTDLTKIQNLVDLFNLLEDLRILLEQVGKEASTIKGGKRKHTRRKHCRHGKNIMHCPYCKHSTKGKHCNKSKKGKKRRRTRKVDRIARSLERSLEHSLNGSSRSKKVRRSRIKSK